jgi:pimeloyl-ACP methyl ester carboxylesterase
MGENLEQAIGALNGAIGDYLKRTGNGLATPMQLVVAGRTIEPTEGALRAAYPAPSRRVVVLVHGLMSTEIVWRMPAPEGERGAPPAPADYGSMLAADLGLSPVYVRYNSGLHISENGEALDALLEALVQAWPGPIDDLLLLGHSMGGLVIRSASHAAAVGSADPARARRWLPLVKRAIYVGSPHLGAPLERLGNAITWALGQLPNPVTRVIADVANLRSAGVKDLRYANLRREDWEGADADALLQNRRHPVPLLEGIRHHLIASSLVPGFGSASARGAQDDGLFALLFGDAIVPVDSATGRARAHHRSAIFPQEHVRLLVGKDHLTLAHDLEVYAAIRDWCAEAIEPAQAKEPSPCSAGAV